MEMRVSEHVLPGSGMRYEIDVAGGRRLFVIARRDGRREIGVMGEADEPETHVVLDQQGAVTIAALLLGARFTVDTREENGSAPTRSWSTSSSCAKTRPRWGCTRPSWNWPILRRSCSQ